MKFSLEIRDKIKTFIKDKLIEINAYVDDELPEYIVVLTSHRKSRTNMVEDLRLFLGRNTEKFVDWLIQVLDDLESSVDEISPNPVSVPNTVPSRPHNLSNMDSQTSDEQVVLSEGEITPHVDDLGHGRRINENSVSGYGMVNGNSHVDQYEDDPEHLKTIDTRVVINRINFAEQEGPLLKTGQGPPSLSVTFRNDQFESPKEITENVYVEKGGKIPERCKFWPICKNGDTCQFHHPNKLCKAFPNCKFGEKCNYIHPNCAFDSACTRHNCPYTHTAKNVKSGFVSVHKFRPIRGGRMTKRGLSGFSHYGRPQMCRFGSNCSNRAFCQFHHSTVPAGRYKWIRPVDPVSSSSDPSKSDRDVPQLNP